MALTVAQYAKRRGVTRQMIHQQIKSGVISPGALVRKKGKVGILIRPRVADSDIKIAATEVSRPISAGIRKEIVPDDAFDHDPEETPAVPPEDDDNVRTPVFDPVGDKYRNARLSTEELKSRKLQLEVLEREGSLLPVDEVKERITKLVAEARDAIMNTSARIAPDLVAITNPVEMETRLNLELNAALASFARLERSI